jgi:hypothetical protein
MIKDSCGHEEDDSFLEFQDEINDFLAYYDITRDGNLERHFYSRFLGINSNLLRLEFLSGFLP